MQTTVRARTTSVAPRADKSIPVHERHDNDPRRSPRGPFPLVAGQWWQVQDLNQQTNLAVVC
jgi:hypothetical protein